MNELTELTQNDITITGSEITFPSYETYLQRAQDIAAYIQTIEPDEDSIKSAKTVVANARKVTDGLNKKRIEIKKEILRSYDRFEGQIKTICSTIGDAEDGLRGKIRELDEAERELKKEDLRRIWKERSWCYEFAQMRPDAFDLWLTPSHLNKTTTLAAAERDMVSWLEKTSREMETARTMGEEYLTEYIKSVDLAAAVDAVNGTKAARKAIHSTEPAEEKAYFFIAGKAYITLTEKLLNENGIKFEKENL